MSHVSVGFALLLSCAFIVLHLKRDKDLLLFSSQRSVGSFIDKVR